MNIEKVVSFNVKAKPPIRKRFPNIRPLGNNNGMPIRRQSINSNHSEELLENGAGHLMDRDIVQILDLTLGQILDPTADLTINHP